MDASRVVKAVWKRLLVAFVLVVVGGGLSTLEMVGQPWVGLAVAFAGLWVAFGALGIAARQRQG